DKTHIESVCRLSMVLDPINFDMLKALVEEMNRYNETPQEAMKILNTKPEMNDALTYSVALSIDGTLVDSKSIYSDPWRGNPLVDDINIVYVPENNDDTDVLSFNGSHLTEINPV